MNVGRQNDEETRDFDRRDLMDAGLALRGFAASGTVNRTHRVMREQAKKIEARRSRLRSLWIPATVSTFLFAAVLFAVWSAFDQYEIAADALDSSQQIMVLLLWCLPLSLVVLAVVWMTRSGAGSARDGGGR